MAIKELKNIFLSASIPLPERDVKYFKTADIVAIRDAVIAFTTVVIPKHRIIWGGHPSITPLVYYVMERLNLNIQDHVKLYQSLWFEHLFSEDNNEFKNIIFVEKLQDPQSSIHLMRQRMLTENEYSAAVFIGGMEGVETEYMMFKERYPEAVMLPVASTGAAAKIVYNNYFREKEINERLLNDYGYMSLFQKFLIDKL